MAYVKGELVMAIPRIGGATSAVFMYNSADAATTVRVSGYITDGNARGMRIGDIVIQSDRAGATVGHIYTVVSVTNNGAADLGDGVAIDVTDSD